LIYYSLNFIRNETLLSQLLKESTVFDSLKSYNKKL
jgi:hypothetical protein